MLSSSMLPLNMVQTDKAVHKAHRASPLGIWDAGLLLLLLLSLLPLLLLRLLLLLLELAEELRLELLERELLPALAGPCTGLATGCCSCTTCLTTGGWITCLTTVCCAPCLVTVCCTTCLTAGG